MLNVNYVLEKGGIRKDQEREDHVCVCVCEMRIQFNSIVFV